MEMTAAFDVYDVDRRESRAPVILIVVGCFAYEWVGVFEVGLLQQIVAIFKMVVPISLVLSAYRYPLPRDKNYVIYLFLYVVFMMWGMVSNVLSGNAIDSTLQWAKYIPRLLFYMAVGVYFYHKPKQQIAVMKALVVVAVLTVAQYVLLMMAMGMGFSNITNPVELPTARGGCYYGPYGMLGNGTALLGTNIEAAFVRLTGFWLEPSNASGYLFMAMYLAGALNLITGEKRWRRAAGICFLGGCLSFSNAGFVAVAIAAAFKQLVGVVATNEKRLLRLASIGILVFLAFGVFAVRSRAVAEYVAANYEGNELIISVSRVRSGSAFLEGDALDGGRKAAAEKAVQGVSTNPTGFGFRVPGKTIDEEVGEGSGSAVVTWLLYTGVVGMALLLMREGAVIRAASRRIFTCPYEMCLFQAYLVLLIQNLSYGTWMTPLFFVIVNLVFFSKYCLPPRSSSGQNIFA